MNFPSEDVTYDNKESGLESQNVQGAIDELYGICTAVPAGDQIIATSNLEKDHYECRYFFTGENPNNYITFNGEKAGWRIISVECDGTLKIMKIADINTSDNLAWDSTASNNWAKPASLNTYLNSTYYNSLSNEAKEQIVSHDFSIGAITYDNFDLQDQINDENSSKWNGKIALVTVSEFLRTNSNGSCNTYGGFGNRYYCTSYTWIYLGGDSTWTLSPTDNSSKNVTIITLQDLYGQVVSLPAIVVRPVVYLNSNIKISGSGTQSDPYTIK